MMRLNNQQFEKMGMRKGGDEKGLSCVGFGQIEIETFLN